MATQDARQDKNEFPTNLYVAGSNGTAAVGTEDTVAGRADPSTGAQYVYNLGPAGSVTLGNITGGTINEIGTVLGLGGTVQVEGTVVTGAGTQPVRVIDGTVTNVGTNVGVGTVTNLGSVTNIGTVKEVSNVAGGSVKVTIGTIVGPTASGGTPTTAPVLMAGTDSTGTVYAPLITAGGVVSISGAVTLGTLVGLGTVTNVGSLTNVGTIKEVANLATGTLAVVSNVVKGTVTKLEGGTVQTNVETGTLQSSGTTTGVGVVSNLTNGSVNILTGTVTSLTNVAGGTLQKSSIPVQIGTPLVTVGTTGAAVWGTLVAASGAGTKQYVSRTSIVVQSGTVDVAVTNIGVGGSTGAGVLERGQFVQGGGITNNYDPVIASGTNGTLSYWLGGAGTVAITITYWNGV